MRKAYLSTCLLADRLYFCGGKFAVGHFSAVGLFLAFCASMRYDVCKTSKPLTALSIVQRIPL